MIRAMRNEGPIDALFGFFGRSFGPREPIPMDRAHAPIVIVCVLACALALIGAHVRFGNWAGEALYWLFILGTFIFARWSRSQGF